MNKAVIIEKFCEKYKFDNTFKERYSGRYMFGRECVGIVCINPFKTIVDLCDYLKEIDEIESFSDFLGEVGYDNIGFQTILYFKGISKEIEY